MKYLITYLATALSYYLIFNLSLFYPPIYFLFNNQDKKYLQYTVKYFTFISFYSCHIINLYQYSRY